jgi:hypothetical protein
MLLIICSLKCPRSRPAPKRVQKYYVRAALKSCFSAIILSKHLPCGLIRRHYMTEQPYSEEQIRTGLLQASSDTFEYLYRQVQPNVTKAITDIGGTQADGRVFYTTALTDWRRLIGAADVHHVDTEVALTQLALAHYKSWRTEREATTPSIAPSDISTPEAAQPTASSAATDVEDKVFEPTPLWGMEPETPEEPTEPQPIEANEPPIWLPDNAALTRTRRHIFVWKGLLALPPSTQQSLLSATPSHAASMALSDRLRLRPTDERPEWITSALNEHELREFWQKSNEIEHRRYNMVDGDSNPTFRGVAKYVFVFLLCSLIGAGAYWWLNKPKPVEKDLFEANFQRPESILSDMKARHSDSTLAARPQECQEVFEKVDELYRAEQWQDAANLIAQMLDNPSLAECQSDASYFLAVMHIERGNPEIGLMLLGSIEDIESFGEDLYWYQTLAYIKIAQSDITQKETAQRAVNRFLQQSRDSARIEQAQKMMEKIQ